MYRICVVLSLCVFGALAYRMDFDLEDWQDWQYNSESKAACTKDIIIVLDTSKSIKEKDFKEIQKFLQKLVANEALNVKQDGTRIGFVTFSDTNVPPLPARGLRTMKRLDIGAKFNAEELGQYFLDLVWKNIKGGVTRTDIGLQIATKMFEEYDKKHPKRREFGDVAIVITDGKPYGRSDQKDFKAAKDAAKTLKAQGKGVLVIGAGVGADFSKTRSSKGPKEVKKLKDFMKTMATTPENVIFQENFENLDNIIAKLVADSCFGAGPACICSESVETRPLLTKLGESTVRLGMFDPLALFQCSPKTYTPKILKHEVNPALPEDNEFPVGKVTYKYTFTLDKVKSGPLTCPYTVNVRKAKQCSGAAYDSVAEVCCCGSIHKKKTGYKCCGTDYYHPRSQQCCEGATLISASKTCLQ